MGINYQKLGRTLMDVDELAVMDNGKCILQVQGIRERPQYEYLLDSSKKNYFDIEKYLRRRLTVRPDDVFECCKSEAPPMPEEPAG